MSLWCALLLASGPTVVSLSPLAPLQAGIHGSIERYVLAEHFSARLLGGASFPGSGDSRSTRAEAGLELRGFLHVGPLSSALGAGSVGGPFAYVRAESAWIFFSTPDGARRATQLSTWLGLGYRLLPLWRLSVCVNLGLGTHYLRLPSGWVPNARTTLGAGLDVGLVL